MNESWHSVQTREGEATSRSASAPRQVGQRLMARTPWSMVIPLKGRDDEGSDKRLGESGVTEGNASDERHGESDRTDEE